MAIKTININYHFVNPINHRDNNAEISIHTFKNHFIAVLCIVYAKFQLQLWDRMIQQSTKNLNLLQKSRLHPHLLTYKYIYGYFITNAHRYPNQGQE